MTRYAPQWLQDATYPASVDRRLFSALWGPDGAVSGCLVHWAGSGMDLTVDPGQVAVPSADGTGCLLCTSDAPEALTLDPAPPSGQDRCDLVVCQARGNDLDGGPDNDFVFLAVTGAPYVPPFDGSQQPATPANALELAYVIARGGAATIAPADIADLRGGRLLVPGGVIAVGTANDNQARTSSNFGNAADIARTKAVATRAGRTYRVRFQAASVNAQYTSGNGQLIFQLSMDNGTALGGAFQLSTKVQNLAGSPWAEFVGELPAGVHTFAIRAWGGGGVNSWNYGGSQQVVTVEDLGPSL